MDSISPPSHSSTPKRPASPGFFVARFERLGGYVTSKSPSTRAATVWPLASNMRATWWAIKAPKLWPKMR